MALTPFATAEQMEQRSEGAIPVNHPYIEEALQAASTLIRSYCGWHIYPNETVTAQRVRPFAGRLYLRTAHLTGVEEIAVDGVAADLTDLDWQENGDLDCIAHGRRITVTYTHGYADAPADLIDLTLQIAARALSSPLGAVREQSLASSVTWSQAGFNVAGGSVLLDHEKAQLEAYKIGYIP